MFSDLQRLGVAGDCFSNALFAVQANVKEPLEKPCMIIECKIGILKCLSFLLQSFALQADGGMPVETPGKIDHEADVVALHQIDSEVIKSV